MIYFIFFSQRIDVKGNSKQEKNLRLNYSYYKCTQSAVCEVSGNNANYFDKEVCKEFFWNADVA